MLENRFKQLVVRRNGRLKLVTRVAAPVKDDPESVELWYVHQYAKFLETGHLKYAVTADLLADLPEERRELLRSQAEQLVLLVHGSIPWYETWSKVLK